MTYRAEHVTQWDGSRLEASNCRMAVGATHLDFHTRGVETSTGARMRAWQDDQVGGTDGEDLLRAWRDGYGETLTIRDGNGWDRLERDRAAGRFVAVDVWYEFLPRIYRCQDAARFGHTMGISPEPEDERGAVVTDPLCSAWKRIPLTHMRSAAEEWKRRVAGGSGRTGGSTEAGKGSPRPANGGSGTGTHPEETGGSTGEIFVPINYTTSDSGADMQSFVWLSGPAGRITIKPGVDGWYYRLRDGAIVPVKSEYVQNRQAIPVRLLEPIPGGPAGSNRENGYLFRSNEAKFMLEQHVDFTPDTEDCSAEVAAERQRIIDCVTNP